MDNFSVASSVPAQATATSSVDILSLVGIESLNVTETFFSGITGEATQADCLATCKATTNCNWYTYIVGNEACQMYADCSLTIDVPKMTLTGEW